MTISNSLGTTSSQFLITPAAVLGPPTTGVHLLGELHEDSAARVYRCSAAGTPGTWIRLVDEGSSGGVESTILQTTDATVTVLDSITIPEDGVFQVEVDVVAVRANGSDQGAVWKQINGYILESGVLTEIGSGASSVHTGRTSGNSYGISWQINGTNAELLATGKNSHTVNWRSFHKISQILQSEL